MSARRPRCSQRWSALLFALISLALGPIPAFADAATEWQGPLLKELGALHGIQVGAMGTVNPWNPATEMTENGEFSDPEYVAFAELHFDRITSGQNFLNFNVWTRPSDIEDPATYSYLPDGQQFVATATNFTIHGAHMLWHSALAPWMSTAQGFVAPDVETFMNHHIDNLAQLYPQIDRWNVVNEAIKDAPQSTTAHVAGNLRDTVWKQEIGDDFIFRAFERATQAGIGTRIYNDYGIANPVAPKTRAVLQLVTALKAQGLIDGIGFQMHLSALGTLPTYEEFRSNFEQFSALGLEIHITEFDILHCNTESCRTGVAPQTAFALARACRAVPACKSFSFWGIRNDLSWVHPARVAPENAALASLYALPFDENYAPTPVFDAVVQAWEVQSALPSLGGPAFIALVIALSACGILAAPRTRARPCWTRHESRVP